MGRDASLSRRRLLRFGALAGLGLTATAALAGCGETTTEAAATAAPAATTAAVAQATVAATTAAAAPKAASGTAVFWTFWAPDSDPGSEDFFAHVKTDFEGKNPGLKLDVVIVPFGTEYIQKLQASSAAGDPPDLSHVSMAWARDLYDLGVLSELNENIATNPDTAMENFFPGASFYNQKQGRIYGVPMEGPETRVFYYDIDAFKEAGIDPDWKAVSAWKWETFRENALKLTKREGDNVSRAGYLVSVLGAQALAAWLYTQKGIFYNADQTELVLTKDGKAKAAIEFHLKLLNKDKISLALSPERQDGQMFREGKTAMVDGGPWNINAMRLANKNFDMIAFPEGPGGSGMGTVGWYNMVVIPKKAKNPDGGWAFAEYYTSLQSFIDRLKIMKQYSPRPAFYDTPEWKAEVAKEPAMARIPEVAKVGGPFPFVRFSEMNSIYQPLLEGVFVNGEDIDKALAEIEAQVNPILQKAGGA